jgi:creatinine amidohydrolase
MNQLQEICRAIARHGFRRIVLVNGHGGNSHPSQAALVSINRELGFPVYFLGYWSGTDESKFLESQKGIIHACESETSLMLAVDETLVDPIYKETKGNPGSVTPLEEAGLISTFHTMESHTENGVMGNSYLATKEKGEAMIAEMVGNLTRILSDDCLWHGRV